MNTNVYTKVIVIGGDEVQNEKKQIVFERMLNDATGNSDDALKRVEDVFPDQYNYIELICRNYQKDCDLMFAYNEKNDRSAGVLFIVRFNDGVVKY
jgi:hypothetical protein